MNGGRPAEMPKKQIVSRKRVADHGEVLTHDREVIAMLDLVQDETGRIESRFLEPACGTGNFLTEVLKRKLTVVAARYSASQLEYERYAVLAVSSVFGIDILEDNAHECRGRLFRIFDSQYTEHFGRTTQEKCRQTVRYILERNIIWGDALSLKTVSDSPQPIVFSEWSPVNGSMMKRRDFTFRGLLDHAATKELPLFSDHGEDVFIPTPVKEFPLVHFLEIPNADK